MPPFSQEGCGQRMPRKFLVMAEGLTPARKDKEIRRAMASDWEAAQPPDLPICVNTSHRPASSWLSVT